MATQLVSTAKRFKHSASRKRDVVDGKYLQNLKVKSSMKYYGRLLEINFLAPADKIHFRRHCYHPLKRFRINSRVYKKIYDHVKIALSPYQRNFLTPHVDKEKIRAVMKSKI